MNVLATVREGDKEDGSLIYLGYIAERDLFGGGLEYIGIKAQDGEDDIIFAVNHYSEREILAEIDDRWGYWKTFQIYYEETENEY